MMTYQINVRTPWLDMRLVLHLRGINEPAQSPGPTLARTIFRFALSLFVPLVAASIQATLLCGLGLWFCDIFLGQPSLGWYGVLHAVTVLCSVQWFYLWRRWAMAGVWPVVDLVRRLGANTLASYRTGGGAVDTSNGGGDDGDGSEADKES